MTDLPIADLPIASAVIRGGIAPPPARRVVLGYDQRFLRRRRLIAEDGGAFLVDLPETVSLQEGDALLLSDGSAVAVAAAVEPVLRVTGDLPRLAWHIGNRHTPCQFAEGALVIRADHVLAAMLRGLGAGVTEGLAPFAPEGGAYGIGRTLGHDHGHDHGDRHDHAHGDHGHGDHGHGHHHDHAPLGDPGQGTFGEVRRASPVAWGTRSPGAAPLVEHELPARGPFDDEAP